LQQAYDNLNDLRRHRNFTVVAEAVVINPFLPHILDFHKWCRENDYISFVELNRKGNNGCDNDLSASPGEVRDVFLQLQEWDYANSPELADNLLTPPAYGTKCTMSITGLHVKNFGDDNYSGVYSCCAQSICHGDLRKKALQEIITDSSMEVYKNQDKWISGPCRNCNHYQMCRGGCRGEATLAFGCPRASCPACWHIPKEIRKNPKKMMPETCSGCPLENDPGCQRKI